MTLNLGIVLWLPSVRYAEICDRCLQKRGARSILLSCTTNRTQCQHMPSRRATARPALVISGSCQEVHGFGYMLLFRLHSSQLLSSFTITGGICKARNKIHFLRCASTCIHCFMKSYMLDGVEVMQVRRMHCPVHFHCSTIGSVCPQRTA